MPSFEKYVNPRIKAQEIFLLEVERRLPEAEKALGILEKSGYNPETAMALYKFVLTLKGNGQMVGLWEIADSASDIMVALLLLGKYETPWNPGISSFMQERFKDIREYLTKIPTERVPISAGPSTVQNKPEEAAKTTASSPVAVSPAPNRAQPAAPANLSPAHQPAAVTPSPHVQEVKKTATKTAAPNPEEPVSPMSPPIQPEKPEPPVKEPKQPDKAEPVKEPLPDKKVLLVDDDPAVFQSVQPLLTGKGYTLLAASDTKSAVQTIKQQSPNLVILDIQKSTGDPVKLCQAIRSNKDWQPVPLIFLNAQDLTQEKLAGFTSSADDYLAKPFKPGELVTRIQVILSRNERSQDLVYQDELTKLHNRRFLIDRLQSDLAFAQRTEGTLSLGLLDVDSFKRVNELYGRLAGDETIICLVERIQSALRSTDLICRYGGASFAIVMPNTTKYEAFCFMDRIREKVSGEPFPLWQRWLNIHLSFSAGISSYPIDGESLDILLKTAETTLHQAKTSGKNRVSM